MDMVGRIRRLHSRGKKSEREISRMTGLSRNTIAKWLKAPLDGEPKYRRSEQPGKLTAFHEVLKQALKADAHRHGACTDLCTPASPVSDGGRGLKQGACANLQPPPHRIARQ